MKKNPYLLGAQILGGFVDEDAYIENVPIDYGDEISDEDLAAQAAFEIETAIQDAELVAPISQPASRALPSPLEGVSDDDWTKWVLVMRTSDPNAVSNSNALGMFAFKLRRLEDIGLMRNVAPINARKTGHMGWTGEWIAPLSQDAFLNNPSVQYRALAASSQLYTMALADGDIAKPSDDKISLSGALALLHKCGPRGFEQWSDESKRKPSTVALYGAANEIF